MDISYTKPEGIDDTPCNLVETEMKQLYVGGTDPGEWTKHTMQVKESETYQLGIMYTSNQNGRNEL